MKMDQAFSAHKTTCREVRECGREKAIEEKIKQNIPQKSKALKLMLEEEGFFAIHFAEK